MRRYKLLFIDDETIIRESLIHMIDWTSHGFDVVGAFKDGEEAWSYLEHSPADIIVTDINMPFMDGIELLQNIRARNHHARVIFLTGYEYFEYAQKAVQLRAFEFLLKPVTQKMLLDAVSRAAHDIEQEEIVNEAADKGLEVARSLFFHQLLYGTAQNIPEKAQKLDVCFPSGNYLPLIVTIDSGNGQRADEQVIAQWKSVFKKYALEKARELEHFGGGIVRIYFAKDINPHLQAVLFFSPDSQCSKQMLQTNWEWMAHRPYGTQKLRVTLFVGVCCERMKDLPQSFRAVCLAVEQRHTLGGENWELVYAAEHIARPEASEKLILPTDTILHHIRMGRPEDVEREIRKIYEPFHQHVYISLSSARMITTELAVVAFKGETADSDQSVSYLYYLNHLQELNTLSELEEDIVQFAVSIARKRKVAGNTKNGLAEKALEYLRQNYGKETLSLNDVAAFLNISVPYLAVLFKQETEQTFSAHLLTIRMEKAKELLKTTDRSIAEISEQVGYSSPQYFISRFKKYTGISPGVYRSEQAKT